MQTISVGGATLAVLDDGRFDMPPDFLSGPAEPGIEDRTEGGRMPLPIQAFAVTGRRTVLVDAGLGPDPERALSSLAALLNRPRQAMSMVGTAGLVRELAAHGIERGTVDTVAISHLHIDHTGWLADADGSPIFENARILLPRADFEHFVTGGHASLLPRETVDALRALVGSGRAELFDGETVISPEVTALPAPGHTPGHTVFAVVDSGERAVLVGDALYCPAQLGELEVGAIHDVDPVLARRTRELIARDVEKHEARAIGCHFAGGRVARLVSGRPVIG
ncbi:MBL fold metallo-hydrolase [Nocardia sp. NPDC052278]|uniref:MBL fold metallo-hydrolase n=1 Tax=unclassified Nocardia TaxID=2637762 RepID=UPI0036A28562